MKPSLKQRSEISLWTVLADLGLLVLSSILFQISHPNPLFQEGLGFLGFFALIPVFFVIARANWLQSILYGGFYGFLTYALFNYWLATFHPLAILIVPMIYMSYFLLLFPALKAAVKFFPPGARIWIQIGIWLSYELLRTWGFLGYSYGILGYTQWQMLPMIQIAEITGVWGVSFLVIFPSVFLGNALQIPTNKRKDWILSRRPSLMVYGVLLSLAILWGLVSPMNTQHLPSWRPALIQHNVDPWKGGDVAYRNSLDILRFLSEKAIQETDPQAVIWSETAFVPSIHYHTKYRENPYRYRMVQELLDYLGEHDIPFILGNDQGEKVQGENGDDIRVDYNAVIHYENGGMQQVYRKTHLVPFTEHFPYRGALEWMRQMLLEADTHFWEKGQEYTVFELGNGLRVSTPVCFEDTFGYLTREFVNRGAQVLVNVTNDSWSGSVSSMLQHFSMAVFRSVETRRSTVRSANGGWTAAIDPNGQVLGQLEPFTQDYLTVDVPVVEDKETLYLLWGDIPMVILMGITLLILALGSFRGFFPGNVDNKINS